MAKPYGPLHFAGTFAGMSFYRDKKWFDSSPARRPEQNADKDSEKHGGRPKK